MMTAYRSNGLPVRLPPAAFACPAVRADIARRAPVFPKNDDLAGIRPLSSPSGVEQNAAVTIFPIAAAVFLPPVLVASIHGMNVISMPELEWVSAHFSSLVPMAVSAIVPFFFFRWKGWL